MLFSYIICVYLLNFIDGYPYKNANGGYDPKPLKPERLVETTTPQLSSKNLDVNNTYRPCDSYDEEKPNYSAPNRRVSQVKCYDYIWALKNREIKAKRTVDCTVETLRKQGNFAILSGRVSHEGEFPHMAAIGWRTTSGSLIFKCGGSLISERFVLTAGHCIRSMEDTSLADLQPKVVRLGRNNIREMVKIKHNKMIDMKISEIIRYPFYAPPKKYYDIALLKLERDVVFTERIYPACLWTNVNLQSAGSKGTVTGWGVEKLGAEMTSPLLKAAEVDFVNQENCDSLLEPYRNRHWCGVQDHQICAGTLAGGTDTCQGDSGGPIQVKMNLPTDIQGNMYFILGITSFGVQCGLPNIPGIYTRVATFAEWIEDIVWK